VLSALGIVTFFIGSGLAGWKYWRAFSGAGPDQKLQAPTAGNPASIQKRYWAFGGCH